MNDAPSGGSAEDADNGSAGHGGHASRGAPAHGGDAEAGHTISIRPNQHRVRVIHQGVTFADTHAGFTLCETGCPEVFYFPRADVNMARLERYLRARGPAIPRTTLRYAIERFPPARRRALLEATRGR